ncbi:MAG: hypothetical protein ABIM43_06290 [candidate division WOR-3 bacterium]
MKSLIKNIKDVINSDERLIIPKKFQILIILGYFSLVGYAIVDITKERTNTPKEVPVIFVLPDSIKQHIYLHEVKIAVLDPFDYRPVRFKTRKMFKPLTEPFLLKFEDMQYFPAYYLISFRLESPMYQLPEKIFYYVTENLFVIKDTFGFRLKTSKDKPDTISLFGTALGDTSSTGAT